MYQQPAFSGKFTLRIPKSLHGILAKQAEQEDISLNQYLLSLISFNLGQKYSHLINSSENTIANHLSSNQSNYLAQSGK
ncbi:MAG: toxin-antitoxin system HicB family antitoxin [Desulfotomaculum sp.]|nr:toxin-antitoxin system HicB family antitoxin [Desulfotomaculum sp.]